MDDTFRSLRLLSKQIGMQCAGALCAVFLLLHGYVPKIRACMAQSAPMVPGLVLPVAIIRWVQRSSHWSSFAMEKSAHSASIRITKFSKNISIALIWSSAAAAVMALVISAFLLGAV